MPNNKKNNKEKIIEIGKSKTRKTEEKFFSNFSNVQLNAILLVILAATFLVQGIIGYFQSIHQIEYIRPWFAVVIIALVFLVLSVMLISLGGVINPLKAKRIINLISFTIFFLGFALFLGSLLYLLTIL